MAALVTVVTDPAEFILKATDRCDRCGQQAYVQATFEAGPILMCLHHHRDFGPAMAEKALAVRDETAQLLVSVG